MARRKILTLTGMAPLSLVAAFSARGWRWPLRPGDRVEVWLRDQLVGTISEELLEELIHWHLASLHLREELHRALKDLPPVVVEPAALAPRAFGSGERPIGPPPAKPARPALRGTRGRRLRGYSA